jgi:N-acetylglucosamine-6-sulfatase
MAQPNVVMILVDDADRKLLSASARVRAAIADQGAVGTNFLFNHPLCGPSRASVLRGQYEQNTGVNRNEQAYGRFVAHGGEDSNLATWLHGAGYHTALVGKYMNGYADSAGYPDTWVPQGWDFWFSLFTDANDAFDYDANDNGTMVHYGRNASDYATDVLTRKALEFLASDGAADPFFLMLTPKAPHGPAIPAPRHEGLFPSATYPKNASFNEEDVRDKPWYVSKEKKLDATQIKLIDESWRQRLRCMESVADMVDAVIGALGSRLANTYIIFTSDNGFHMGEHRLGHGSFPGGKNMPYEEDISVPVWMRGPGITPGRTLPQLLGNVDLAPTISEIAGVTPGLNVDGRSFLPLMKGQQISWRNRYLIQRGDGGRAFAGIRSKDNYVFTEFDEPRYPEVPGEYYNLTTDPAELVNGYNQLSGTTRTALRAKVTAYRNCAGATCRTADSSA